MSTTKHSFNYVDNTAPEKWSIQSLVVLVLENYHLSHPLITAMDLEGVTAADTDPDLAMGHVKRWLKAQLKEDRVGMAVSNALDNDKPVQVNQASLRIGGELVTPSGGSVDVVASNMGDRMAREAANILSVHTTHVSGKSSIEWITQDRAAILNMPYIPGLVPMRNLVNVVGPDGADTRDKMYRALKINTPEVRCNLIRVMSVIYGAASMKSFSMRDEKLLEYYNTYRIPDKQPVIKGAFVPYTSSYSYLIPPTPAGMYQYFVASSQILGESKKRAIASMGYYRFDLMASDVNLIDMATDVISICRRYKYRAVRLVVMDYNLAKILNANDISVYCTHAAVTQEESQKITGIYRQGGRKNFLWGIYPVLPLQLNDKALKHPPPLVNDKKSTWFNYSIIPPSPEPGVKYLPCVYGASRGYCIATSQDVKDGEAVESLLVRGAKANSCRIHFIYSRITFVNQDPYRNYYKNSWSIPPRKAPKLRSDIWKDAVEEVIDVKVEAIDQEIAGWIEAVPARDVPSIQEPEIEKYLRELNINDFRAICKVIKMSYDQIKTYPLPSAFSFYLTNMDLDIIRSKVEAELGRRDAARRLREEEKKKKVEVVREKKTADEDDGESEDSSEQEEKEKKTKPVQKKKKKIKEPESEEEEARDSDAEITEDEEEEKPKGVPPTKDEKSGAFDNMWAGASTQPVYKT